MEKKLKSSKATNAGSFFNSQPTSHDLHAPPACQANMPASQPQQHSHPQQQQKQMEQQHASEFPLKEVLLASGVLSVIGMFYFYKKKQTVPFKVCVCVGEEGRVAPVSRWVYHHTHLRLTDATASMASVCRPATGSCGQPLAGALYLQSHPRPQR